MGPAVASPVHAAEWSGDDVSIAEIDRRLASLRHECGHDGTPDLRTSVLTHVAWVPPEWRDAAEEVLAGLAERHPSRTILLYADPTSERPCLDVRVTVEAFDLPGLNQHVGAEVIRLSLCGSRAHAPASVVLPLLLPDLPVFLRWRGRPPFARRELDQLVDVADRLVLDSTEWADLDAGLYALGAYFDRAVVSDIAWARTLPWRRALAALWPGIASMTRLQVAGPRAEAHLLAGWLRSRLGSDIVLDHEERAELQRIAVDGTPVAAASEPKTPSDLLSDQLDVFRRDRIYEEAVCAAGPAALRST